MQINGNGTNNIVKSNGEIDFEAVAKQTRSLVGVGNNSAGTTIRATQDNEPHDTIYSTGKDFNRRYEVNGTYGNDVLDLGALKLPVVTDAYDNHVKARGLAGDDTLILNDIQGAKYINVEGGAGDDVFIESTPKSVIESSVLKLFGGKGHDTLIIKDTVEDANIHAQVDLHVNGITFHDSNIEEIKFADKTLTPEEVRREGLNRD